MVYLRLIYLPLCYGSTWINIWYCSQGKSVISSLLLDLRQNIACICQSQIMRKTSHFYLLNFRYLFLGEYLGASIFFLLYYSVYGQTRSLNCQHNITNINAANTACMHACNSPASTYLPRFNFQQLYLVKHISPWFKL